MAGDRPRQYEKADHASASCRECNWRYTAEGDSTKPRGTRALSYARRHTKETGHVTVVTRSTILSPTPEHVPWKAKRRYHHRQQQLTTTQ